MSSPSPPPPDDSPAPTLSKTQLRKLARQQASALAAAASTDADASSSAQPRDGPSMSVHEALERLDSVGSACSSVVGKRVKVISKKIQRIQTYKDIPKEKLNPDQISALSKLDGMDFTVKELEEVKRAVEVAELEQAAALRAKKFYDAVETDSHSTRLSTVLNLLRTHTILFPSSSSGFAPPSLPPALAQLTGQEVAAIGYLQHSLVTQAEASLVEAISRGNLTEVLEGVTFARIFEILSSLPSPTTIEQLTADAPSTSETKEYQPLQFGSSGLNEENPVPPPQQQHQQQSTDAADNDVRIAHASFASPQSGGGQQMSFGTAVEGSFAPPPPPPAVAPPALAQPAVAQEEVVGKPGLEGEGESLAVVDDYALPSETVESSISAGNADAPLDRITDSPAPATTGDEAAPRERRQRGPRRRKPKTVSAGETETAESSPAPTSRSAGGVAGADGKEVQKKRERRPKTPKTNGDSNGEASNSATTERRAGGGGDRRRQGPRKEGGASKEGGSMTEDGGFQPAPARRHGATAKPSSAGGREGASSGERGGRGGGAGGRGRGGRGGRTNGGAKAEGGAPVAHKTPAAPKAQ